MWTKVQDDAFKRFAKLGRILDIDETAAGGRMLYLWNQSQNLLSETATRQQLRDWLLLEGADDDELDRWIAALERVPFISKDVNCVDRSLQTWRIHGNDLEIDSIVQQRVKSAKGGSATKKKWERIRAEREAARARGPTTGTPAGMPAAGPAGAPQVGPLHGTARHGSDRPGTALHGAEGESSPAADKAKEAPPPPTEEMRMPFGDPDLVEFLEAREISPKLARSWISLFGKDAPACEHFVRTVVVRQFIAKPDHEAKLAVKGQTVVSYLTNAVADEAEKRRKASGAPAPRGIFNAKPLELPEDRPPPELPKPAFGAQVIRLPLPESASPRPAPEPPPPRIELDSVLEAEANGWPGAAKLRQLYERQQESERAG